MPASVLTAPALLMTMTDIAELADVTASRRDELAPPPHRTFPAPAGGDEAQPLFDPREVADWLLATGRIERERAEQELACSCSPASRPATPARTSSPRLPR